MNIPTPPQLEGFLQVARQLAVKAGEIAVQQFHTVQAQVKEDGTLVTSTDQLLDRLICQELQSHYPDHIVLSEEQNTWLAPGDHLTWVIDPLDGTTNFARGLPIWGVSIGLLLQGQPLVGVVHFPIIQETYSASHGMGAWRNRQRIFSAANTAPDNLHLIFRCTRSEKRYRFATQLKPRLMGSAAFHLCKVADGTAFCTLERTPKLWDIAAAAVILHEAGALLQHFDDHSPGDTPLFPLSLESADYVSRSFPLIAAANTALLEAILPQIQLR